MVERTLGLLYLFQYMRYLRYMVIPGRYIGITATSNMVEHLSRYTVFVTLRTLDTVPMVINTDE